MDLSEGSGDLWRYLRDLVALSTLPAMWVGQPSHTIAESVADALNSTLHADFTYVRLASVDASGATVEAACTERGSADAAHAQEIGRVLEPWLRPNGYASVSSVPRPIGGGTSSVAVVPVGRPGNTLGVIAAGSQREGFPSKHDLLFIRVLVNQAAIALEGAQLRVVQDELAERQRVEEMLRRSEERFRALIERSSDMITLQERDGTFTYVSPSTIRLLGYAPTELLGRSLLEAVHPADRTWLEPRFAALVEQPGGVMIARYRLRHKNGTWRWIEATYTNLLEEPAVKAVVINRHDVSAEVEAQQLLEQRVVERTRELESLYQADEMLYRSLQLEDVLQALVDVSSDVLGVQKSLVFVKDPERERLMVRAARGFQPSVLQQCVLAPDEGLDGLALQSGGPVAVSDLAADPRVSPRVLEVLAPTGIQAQLSVPISASGEAFAVFNVYSTARHEFTEEERRLMVALAQRAGLAIENARLYEAAMGKAALEERQRLARELHDSVSQALYGIVLNASAADELFEAAPQRARGLLSDVFRLAEAGLAEMRALIFELRPESLEQEGLVGALEKQAAAVEARHGLRVQLDAAREPELPVATKEVLYRVAQEALHNVVKHARARNLELILEVGEREVGLVVADDGRGFDPRGEFPGHLGLRSMRERAAAVGGTLEISSAPGVGTRLSARVPLAVHGETSAGRMGLTY